MPQPISPPTDYWISGYGLSRHIVLRQLGYFLGPSATVRPYSYHGREGFLINGPPLTKEQIEDLRRQSAQYERQQTMRMSCRSSRGSSSNNEDDDDDCDINEIVSISASRRHSPTHSSASQYRRERQR